MSGPRDLWHAVRAHDMIGIHANLMDASVDIDATGGKSQTTPIIEAVKKQILSIVQWLVKCKADISAKDSNGNNAVVHSMEIAQF